jgi:putative lipoic acid-binding regulatory protein
MIKDYIEFPVIFTFKAIGENRDDFRNGVDKIFTNYTEKSIVENASGGGKYISLSITTEIKDYEELEARYQEIAALPGLKFHV